MIRCFFYSAVFFSNKGVAMSNFGVSLKEFPSLDYLKNQVAKADSSANEIVILSICEVSQEDYLTIFPNKKWTTLIKTIL